MLQEIQNYLDLRFLTTDLVLWSGSRITEDSIQYVCFDEYGNELGVIERRFKSSPRFVLDLHSSDALFLLNKSLPYIYRANEAVIVEGPADALALHRSGLKNVVAFGGASNFGKRKLRLLRRYCDNLWFIFDKDEAGLRFFMNVRDKQKLIVKTSVSFTPREKDPAAFLAKGGSITEFRKYDL